jgi:hypothetical protein
VFELDRRRKESTMDTEATWPGRWWIARLFGPAGRNPRDGGPAFRNAAWLFRANQFCLLARDAWTDETRRRLSGFECDGQLAFIFDNVRLAAIRKYFQRRRPRDRLIVVAAEYPTLDDDTAGCPPTFADNWREDDVYWITNRIRDCRYFELCCYLCDEVRSGPAWAVARR